MAASEDTPIAAELLNADVLIFDEPTGHSDVRDMNDRIGGDLPGQHHVYLQGTSGSCVTQSWEHPEEKTYFEISTSHGGHFPRAGPLEGVKDRTW